MWKKRAYRVKLKSEKSPQQALFSNKDVAEWNLKVTTLKLNKSVFYITNGSN